MRRSFQVATSTVILAVGLAACGSGSAPFAPPAYAADGSWALKDAARQNLLYVSDDVAGKVYMYSYPWGKLEGTISKLTGPASICADNAGHVWIVESEASEIVEYGHGGTKPLRTLQDPGYWPSDCAVNAKTGDLAVANAFTSNGGQGTPGNLAVYTNAEGTPHVYTTPAVNNYMYVTYDDDENLFVDGFGQYNAFALAEMPAGASSLTPITIDQNIDPGNAADVKWDGKYLAVADTGANAIYQIAVRGKRGKKVGTTSLESVSSGYLAHICFPKITRKTGEAARVIVPNSTTVGYWAYPAGGAMKRRVTKSLIFALGVTVSKGP